MPFRDGTTIANAKQIPALADLILAEQKDHGRHLRPQVMAAVTVAERDLLGGTNMWAEDEEEEEHLKEKKEKTRSVSQNSY